MPSASRMKSSSAHCRVGHGYQRTARPSLVVGHNGEMGASDVGAMFAAIQRERLAEAWAADQPGSTKRRVMVALPSYSVGRVVYEHYGDRVPPLENRYFYAVLASRFPGCRVAYLSSLPVPADIAEGYLGLLSIDERAAVEASSRVVAPDDGSRRALAEKLLDRGDLIDDLRTYIGDDPALIEPWNVTEAEAALAVALRAPVHGSDPGARGLATKSNGRKLFRQAGVGMPPGVEDVHTPAEVAAALARLRRLRPDMDAVVVKLDDSVAGDGNVVLRVAEVDSHTIDDLLPDWYVAALKAGGVVEERISGRDFRSPSAQATITPHGDVIPLSTHEQRLGGASGQVFEGCSFPADPDYAAALSEAAVRVGRLLAAEGARGRFALDFVACRNGTGGWDVSAVEINLRKGGTTHPYGITRSLLRGGYDAAAARYVDMGGRPVFYGATDNLVDPRWVGRTPSDARAAVAGAGLLYNRAAGEGVVPHLLDCLAVDGRMGYTAIAHSRARVVELEEATMAALGAHS